MRTTVTFEGRLAANPDLTITQNGKNIVEFTVAVNERRQVDGRWEDGDTTWHRVKAFKQLGENIVESLTQGDLVIVHGTITTDTWTDKDSGEKRSAQKVIADLVGPSLRFASARINKTTRTHAAAGETSEVVMAANGANRRRLALVKGQKTEGGWMGRTRRGAGSARGPRPL
jgi:single-strand DNA-binding protein